MLSFVCNSSGNAVTAMFKKARENVPHVIIIDHLEGLSASEIRELHKQMKSSTEKEFEGKRKLAKFFLKSKHICSSLMGFYCQCRSRSDCSVYAVRLLR